MCLLTYVRVCARVAGPRTLASELRGVYTEALSTVRPTVSAIGIIAEHVYGRTNSGARIKKPNLFNLYRI